MKIILHAILLSFCLSLFDVYEAVCAQDIDWTLKKQMSFESPPLALAPAADGKLVYVLLKSKIILYSPGDNVVVDFLPVDPSFDKMAVTRDNLVVLSGSASGNVKVFQLEKKTRVDVTGLYPQGPSDAPVTIAVYSDYQCPYCARLEATFAQVLEKFPKDVKLVFKNYPLGFHKYARQAATAALAAGAQGRFWDFHHKLMENFAGINDDKIQEIAVSLKLDMDKFGKGMKDNSIQEVINRDLAEAQENGVSGTPTVFINGKPLKDRSLEGMLEAIRNELKVR